MSERQAHCIYELLLVQTTNYEHAGWNPCFITKERDWDEIEESLQTEFYY